MGRDNSAKKKMMTLALDRIQSVQLIDEMKFYDDENFNPDAYYKNVIGVTVNDGLIARNIILKLDRKNAPYILTKTLTFFSGSDSQ